MIPILAALIIALAPLVPVAPFPAVATWQAGRTLVAWEPPTGTAQTCLNLVSPARHLGCTDGQRWAQAGGDGNHRITPGARLRLVAYDADGLAVGVVEINAVEVRPALWLPLVGTAKPLP